MTRMRSCPDFRVAGPALRHWVLQRCHAVGSATAAGDWAMATAKAMGTVPNTPQVGASHRSACDAAVLKLCQSLSSRGFASSSHDSSDSQDEKGTDTASGVALPPAELQAIVRRLDSFRREMMTLRTDVGHILELLGKLHAMGLARDAPPLDPISECTTMADLVAELRKLEDIVLPARRLEEVVSKTRELVLAELERLDESPNKHDIRPSTLLIKRGLRRASRASLTRILLNPEQPEVTLRCAIAVIELMGLLRWHACLDTVLPVINSRISSLDTREKLEVLWTLALLRQNKSTTLMAVTSSLLHRIDNLEGPDLASMTFSCAVLGYWNPTLFVEALDCFEIMMENMDVLDVAKCFWAFTANQLLDREQCDRILSKIMSRSEEFLSSESAGLENRVYQAFLIHAANGTVSKKVESEFRESCLGVALKERWLTLDNLERTTDDIFLHAIAAALTELNVPFQRNSVKDDCHIDFLLSLSSERQRAPMEFALHVVGPSQTAYGVSGRVTGTAMAENLLLRSMDLHPVMLTFSNMRDLPNFKPYNWDHCVKDFIKNTLEQEGYVLPSGSVTPSKKSRSRKKKGQAPEAASLGGGVEREMADRKDDVEEPAPSPLPNTDFGIIDSPGEADEIADLVERLLEKTADDPTKVRAGLQKWRVQELKQLLRHLNEPVSGNKSVLVESVMHGLSLMHA